jgi:hypothetical protein
MTRDLPILPPERALWDAEVQVFQLRPKEPTNVS